MASNEVQENSTPMNEISQERQGGRQEAMGQTLLVLCAGKARAGKSTAMNNLFGVNFSARYSASSVTRNVETRRLNHGNDVLLVVDTPGLGAKDIPTSEAVKKIKSTIGGLEYTLIYCFSVSTDSIIDEADERIVQILQKALTKNVWKKCVILLTHSDTLRSTTCSKLEDRDSYMDFLRDHVRRISAMLKKACGGHVPTVKPIFDITIKDNTDEIIVASPVGLKEKTGKEKYCLLPGMEGGENWKQKGFDEIVRKTVPLCRRTFSAAQGGLTAKIGAGGGVAGAAIGGVIGGLVGGLTTAGIGAFPGAVIGVATGGAAIGITSTTSQLGGSLYKNSSINKKIDNLEQAEFVSVENLPHSDNVPSKVSEASQPSNEI